jgi:hypothetical protein
MFSRLVQQLPPKPILLRPFLTSALARVPSSPLSLLATPAGGFALYSYLGLLAGWYLASDEADVREAVKVIGRSARHDGTRQLHRGSEGRGEEMRKQRRREEATGGDRPPVDAPGEGEPEKPSLMSRLTGSFKAKPKPAPPPSPSPAPAPAPDPDPPPLLPASASTDPPLADALETIVSRGYLSVLTNYDCSAPLLSDPALPQALFEASRGSLDRTTRWAATQCLFLLTSSRRDSARLLLEAVPPGELRAHAQGLLDATAEFAQRLLVVDPPLDGGGLPLPRLPRSRRLEAGHDLFMELSWSLALLDNLTLCKPGVAALRPDRRFVGSLVGLLEGLHPEARDYLAARPSLLEVLQPPADVADVRLDLRDLAARQESIYEPQLHALQPDPGDPSPPPLAGSRSTSAENDPLPSPCFYRWNKGFSVDGRALRVLVNVSRSHPEILLEQGGVLPLCVALSHGEHRNAEFAGQVVRNLCR